MKMQKYIGMFISSAPSLVEKLTLALSKNDFEEIASQVHSYKSKWIMMGMNETKEIALKVEQQCRQIPVDISVRENTNILLLQIQKAIEELKLSQLN